MNTENRIENKIDSLLKGNKNAGFTNPPTDYFEHFADGLPIMQKNDSKTISFLNLRNKWFQVSTVAVAAMLLLALWLFVFDADIKSETELNFTVEELMALNDFQNYNEDLIYSELAFASESDEVLSNDAEMDALLDLDGLSADEIIELYSTDY